MATKRTTGRTLAEYVSGYLADGYDPAALAGHTARGARDLAEALARLGFHPAAQTLKMEADYLERCGEAILDPVEERS